MSKKIDIGYSFEESRIFSETELKKMAKECGDLNFIHHDTLRAKETRFDGIIASGSAISALFSTLIPTHFSHISPMLGLEMSFKFPAPIKPNVNVSMIWAVSDIQEKPAAGTLVNLKGIIKDNDDQILVVGTATILLLAKL